MKSSCVACSGIRTASKRVAKRFLPLPFSCFWQAGALMAMMRCRRRKDKNGNYCNGLTDSGLAKLFRTFCKSASFSS